MKLQIIQNKENLKQLTNTLLRKNERIKSLETQISYLINKENINPTAIDVEEKLLNLRILTADDWSAFKSNFDTVYPGFIKRLRESFTLSEAEERLFLLLKLKLTKNEIADILGVLPSTVKKTRNRLRKRLELDTSESLSNFAEVF